MCGRFYVDDETAREIQKLVRKIDEQLKKAKLVGGCASDRVRGCHLGGES